MSIDAQQLRLEIVRPTLKHLGLYSPSAEELLLGTAAQESHLGTYLRQLGGGPALGIYQMEPATHDDIWEHYLRYKPAMADELRKIAGVTEGKTPRAELMVGNLYYATAMARVFYLRKPQLIPPADQVADLGDYWKTHYNTYLGRGQVGEFIENYKRFVKEG